MKSRSIILFLAGIGIWELAWFHFTFLFWILYLPIFVLLYSQPFKRAAGIAIIYSLSVTLLTFYWPIYYSFPVFLGSTFLFTSFISLFLMASWMGAKKTHYLIGIWIPPLAWMFLKFLYSFSVLDSWALNHAIFQPMLAPLIWVIGSTGTLFLLIFMSSLFFFYAIKRKKILLVMILVLGSIILANYLYSVTAEPEGNPVKVALIQANFNQDWKWRVTNANGEVLAHYETLTREAAQQNPDIIIWPEYALPFDLEKNEEALSRLSQLAKESNANLILGTLRWLEENDNLEKRKKNNVALSFSRDGSYLGEYTAISPFPLESWTIPGDELGIFTLEGKKAGITMCYEETQKHINKKHKKEGTDFLISLSNNQRFSKSERALYLSSLYPRLSAIENKQYMLRVTNTGRTMIVDPYGKIVAELPPNTQGILHGTILI